MSRIASIPTIALCLLLAASVALAAQRGGGGGGGGGQRVAVPRSGSGAGHPSDGHVVAGYPYGHPYYPVAGSFVFVGGYYYDPFYGPYPWWPASAYGWGYSPVFDYRAELRVQATPKEAAVYVDGFYAGTVDDFDGTFQRLPLTPGGHHVELYLEGYRTISKSLYLQPGGTLKLHEILEPLGPGETSEKPKLAPPVPRPPEGTYNEPQGGPGLPPPPPPPPPVQRGGRDRHEPPRSDTEGFGTLVLHVQPAEAEVSIDGQRWVTSGEGEFQLQLPAGRHRVEVELQGFQRYSSDVEVRDDGPTPVNISLSRAR